MTAATRRRKLRQRQDRPTPAVPAAPATVPAQRRHPRHGLLPTPDETPLADAILALAAATTPAEVHAARLAALRTRSGLLAPIPMGTAGNTLLGGDPDQPGRPVRATHRIARLTRAAHHTSTTSAPSSIPHPRHTQEGTR